MNELNNHYRMLLGLDEAWLVKSVDLSMESKRVVIALEHRGGSLTCPECGISCTRSLLRVTTFSTFVSENSALAVELILSAHSQGGIGLTRCVDD